MVILDLLAGEISCSAELSMKKSFITSGPGIYSKKKDPFSEESKHSFDKSCLLEKISISLNHIVLLNRIYPTFANSVDKDQLASEEANCSGIALFAIKYVNI